MRGYILDLDNTLYDENQYLYYVFMDFWKKRELDLKIFENICHQTLCDQSRLNSKDIFKTFLELTPLGYTQESHNELFKIYTTIRCDLDLYQDARDFLDFISQKKYLIAILTNGPVEAQKNKIKNLGLTHLPIFYARENGIEYEKPHLNAFQKVLDFFSLSANMCYMIGDNPHTDLYGANQIGITPIWLQRGYAKKLKCDIQCKNVVNFNEIREYV